MRKKLLFLLLILSCISIKSYAQYDCWSIQFKGGVNTIRGLYRTIWDRDYNSEFGSAVEYTISPIIGIGGEFLYLNNNHHDANFTSSILQTTLFTSLNLTNLSLKYRSGFWQRFNAYVNVGAGFGTGSWKQDFGSADNINLAGSVGMNFEYNINRLFAVGLEFQYWWNSNAKYNPKMYSGNKDFYTSNLNFRFKIPTRSRDHIRNLDQLWNIHI